MPLNLLALPEYKSPGAYNWAPLAEGVQSIVDGQRQNKLLQIKQQAQDLDNQRFGLDQKKFDSSETDRVAERLGNQALAADQLQGSARAAAHARIIAAHPNGASLPREYHDPEIGPRLMAADYGKYKDVQAEKYKDAQIGLAQAQAGQAREHGRLFVEQGKALGQKDELTGVITNMLKPALNGLAPQQSGAPVQPIQPRVQPQDGPGFDPAMVRPISDPTEARPPAAPSRGGLMQNMSPEQRRTIGQALLLNKTTEAFGKSLMEESDKDQLGKEARNEVDKKEEKATDGLLRVRAVRSSFDPSYLNFGTQGKMAWSGLMSKFGTLPPAQQEGLYRFATFRRDAANNINSAIKDNSGATVTDQELKRNLIELPNAGSGIFDGDDPVTFKAKLDRAEDVLALGVARTRYLRQHGFTGTLDAAAAQMPIERMREMINTRARNIEGEVRRGNPTLPKNIIDREVDMRVKKEFGI